WAPRGSASLANTVSLARPFTICDFTVTADASAGDGGVALPNAVAFQLSTSDSPFGHAIVTVRWSPGTSFSDTACRASGAPSGEAFVAIVFLTAVGAGMQPMNGLNSPGR